MAINAKQKRDNEFIEKINNVYSEFCDNKNEYEKAFTQMESLKSKEEKDIPVKLLKSLCSYKKRKGDKPIPTK